jgi:hypothetical protein
MNQLAVSTAASARSRQQSQPDAAASTSAANLSASWSEYDQYVTGSTLFLIPGRKVTTSLAGKARSIFSSGAEQKRLRSIRSVFPHEDSIQITNIMDIYAEALGYFRFVIAESLFVHLPHIKVISPGSHCDASKTTIAHLFLAQIRTGHVHYLRIALDNLSSFENQHSLAVIMTTCMNDIENL